MPSRSFENWADERSRALDQISSAHARVGGSQRGRRYATEQLNHAYTTLLSSQFQGFCRDLHSESVDYIVDGAPADYQDMLRTLLIQNRKIDKGNPNPGNLGDDFGRFGISFWTDVKADFRQNDRRQAILENLNSWRNAIAHQDFDAAKLGGTTSLHLSQVQAWRRSLHRLAQSFDNVMKKAITNVTKVVPW
jgi:hypothetical protein